MARRTMTLRRIDPWSVLKFGFVLNICFLAVMLLGVIFVWFVVRQLGIIDQVCQLLLDVGFEECAVDGDNLFRIVLLLGVLATVVLTGLAVFGAFLHNLLADIVGGITYSVAEEGGSPARSARAVGQRTRSGAGVAGGASGPGDASETRSLGTPPPDRSRQDDTPSAEQTTGGGQAREGRGGSSAGSEERPSWTPSSSGDDDRLFGGGSSSGDASSS